MLRPMIHVRFRRVPCSSRSPISSLPIYRSSIKTAFSSDEGRLPFFGRSSMPRALHVQSSRGRSRFGTKEAPSDRYNYTKPASPLSTAEWPEPTYSKLVSGYQVYHHPDSFKLDYGQSLPSFDLAYEVWGELSEKKDNVILLHTGLSASSHAKSHEENRNPGWWEKFIGHGSSYPIDLDRHFVICTNVLGSCYGSTGPHSINPLTGNRYGTEFPIVSIFDMVRAQFKLLNYLGIERLYASVGSSMGGMQSIVAAWLEPERVGKVVSISGCGRSGPSSIAIRYAQRSVLMADPNWNNGFYYDSAPPHVGMKLARQIATITYRSGPEWEQRFGRRRRSVHAHNSLSPPTLSPDFLIETYLDHQGEQFCLKYDANSLLYVSKAMDLFDMTVEGLNELERYRTEAPSSDEPSFSGQPERDEAGRVSSLSSAGDHEIVTSLAHTFKRFQSTQEFLILGVQTDILFPITLQRELAEAIRTSSSDLPPHQAPAVTYFELNSPFGHDTFLIDLNGVGGAIRGFLS
ncbi:hypothetical protein MJO28_007655 [Puccinia striiformis f. sp. tritici]|uniref:AB hydrolase-1 domain-containing protein n=3 Tax=Puccinia striiformis TaxID=27350 RepID=A0A0L0UZ74_9BASI|nr:hypothetical protein Pst134EA_013751 [Puccinia striiformis f. sp. tritici]KAI9604137.1 hypothetical protein H4Q26_003749 [Puccinia striiformis f. sp. tritici PST-130]KNE92034.1 hypothetical protein PSTG_14567 [Puccinia striiformis f. sp. tritici PST-78]POW09469.1 hypothetical protein PSTT_06854 [Puccinia striiformis]KAH9454652.1 hypothetical protein Pst134EB_014718 [Puccinia striiformis f. sp. tritici]KAH9465891.1 hypothetical protein Pst134EA_013751 [Puccinia striiformis f. sp. tritici]